MEGMGTFTKKLVLHYGVTVKFTKLAISGRPGMTPCWTVSADEESGSFAQFLSFDEAVECGRRVADGIHELLKANIHSIQVKDEDKHEQNSGSSRS